MPKQRIKARPLRVRVTDTRRVKPPTRTQGTVNPVYQSVEWRKLTTWIFQVRGRACEAADCRTTDRGAGGRLYCDHIQELADNGPAFDPNNIEIRCPSCHQTKTAAARGQRAAKRWDFVP
jgi:5-methylcytosine-specific restriction enzyme A